MQHLNALDYTAIGVYFLILIFFGFYLATRASRSLEDYFLGGRKLPWWALVFCAAMLGMYRFWYQNLPAAREGIATLEEIEAGQI